MADWLLSIGYERWALTALLAIPVFGAILVMALPAALAKRVALAVTLVELVVSLGLPGVSSPVTSLFCQKPKVACVLNAAKPHRILSR